MHTAEDPEINQIQTQNQVEQDDWLEETKKKCHGVGLEAGRPFSKWSLAQLS